MMEFITIKNDKITVTLCSLGASIYRLVFDDSDMMLSPIKEEDFSKEGVFYNKTVGRICGRILRNNKVVLHGGPHGICHQEFDYSKEDNQVVFTYISKGDESSPNGELNIKIAYRLEDTALITETEITPNQDMEVCLTNHSFFCLGAKSVNELFIKFDSDYYINYDERLLPLNKEKIKDKLNFKNGDTAMKYGDIDNYFFLNNKEVILQSNKYQLKLITDYQGIHIYTDYFLDGVITRLSKNDHHRALAIEPQDDKLSNLLIKANKTIKRTSKYIFNKNI